MVTPPMEQMCLDLRTACWLWLASALFSFQVASPIMQSKVSTPTEECQRKDARSTRMLTPGTLRRSTCPCSST